ncbi:MAG: PilZ domain-containing protein [Deltaproteobacteria bacterium]|nr:PilZ domain-containing protein [Deltaproteobacteria bacterium]
MSGEPGTPAEKLAALNERLKGTSLLSLLNIKSKPAPDALLGRVNDLREVVYSLCAHLTVDDPIRATAIERLKRVEALLHDPVEWHILARAQELRQDPTDPKLRATLEAAFFEEHLPRTVWQSMPPDGAHAELRKSLRLPMLIDVEIDVAGKRVRCQMQNLSRDGVCLEVPAGYSATTVAFTVQMPATNAQVALTGDVVWRDAGRVGVAFKIGVTEQNALDAALQTHFACLQHAVERWRDVAPTSGPAIACVAIVGYASSALPSSRREHLDKLEAAAKADPGSKDLQLALAKLRIEEHDFDGAAQALKRVVIADRADPRYRLLDLTLAQRRGGGGGVLRARLRQLVEAGRVPLAVVLSLCFVGAAVVAVTALQGPLVAVPVPIGGLACRSVDVVDENALCAVDGNAYRQVPAIERASLAAKTLQGLAPRGVRQVTVIGTMAEEGVLDVFSTYIAAPAP